MKSRYLMLALVAMLLPNVCSAQMRITEWMYDGSEFVEFTNLGAVAINMTAWSFDDDTRTAGSFDLSAFGTVNPGQSVIVSQQSAVDFNTAWGLSGVSVIGGSTQQLQRADEINLYDNTLALVDRLTYGDQTIAGSPRTNTASGNPTSLAAIGANNAALWVLASNGDAYGSYTSIAPAAGLFANPGVFAVPEPSTVLLATFGCMGLFGIGRCRKTQSE
jgi:predicted extracellular nuclease